MHTFAAAPKRLQLFCKRKGRNQQIGVKLMFPRRPGCGTILPATKKRKEDFNMNMDKIWAESIAKEYAPLTDDKFGNTRFYSI